MNNQYLVIKDINGKFVTVKDVDLISSMANVGLTLFGISMACIIELQTQYKVRGGKMPMTEDSIRKVFEDAVTKD